jgi:hypothetical protein
VYVFAVAFYICSLTLNLKNRMTEDEKEELLALINQGEIDEVFERLKTTTKDTNTLNLLKKEYLQGKTDIHFCNRLKVLINDIPVVETPKPTPKDYTWADLESFEEKHLFGFRHKTNRATIIAPTYQWANDFREGLAPVKKNGFFGFINQNNQVVIDFQFDDVNVFIEGLAQVKAKGKWGYINLKGAVVIPIIYDSVWLLENDRIKVCIEKKFFFINPQGECISIRFYKNFRDETPTDEFITDDFLLRHNIRRAR